MKNQFLTVLIALLSFTFLNCDTAPKKEKRKSINDKISATTLPSKGSKSCRSPEKNLNISILLDLSDRISYENQATYDRGYLKHIATTFKQHINTKKKFALKDNLRVFFEPNFNDGDINNIASKLKINANKNLSLEKYNSIESIYDKQVKSLYDKAKSDVSTTDGADLFNFFQNKIKGRCIKSCHRNILIILTDGYLYHKDDLIQNGGRTSYLGSKILNTSALKSANWKEYIKKQNKGFIKAQEDLSDLEILVLGINKRNHKNPNAQNIIQFYWNQWFKEMKVKKYKVEDSALPTDVEDIITDFILAE